MVKGGFHSPFMTDAAAAFRAELAQVEFRSPAIRLYSNKTARPYDAAPADLLADQICHPVLWEDLIRRMIGEGIDTFVEIGPGKTLKNMIGKIDPTVTCYTVADLPTLLQEVSP
jgi:[acyl-carrier-protein] S-malonyltransferase